MRKWCELGVLVFLALAAQRYANIIAYMDRGYHGVGGEIFVFPLIVFAGSYFLGFFNAEDPVDDNNEMEDDF